MTPEQYCNQPGVGAGVQAPDCDQYFNCMTREVFNAPKKAYCNAQMKEAATEETEAPATAPPTTAPVKSAKSCAELGWDVVDGSVCAASKVNKECFAGGSLADSTSFCESAGARLCTTAELAADVAKGTGCKADDAAVFAAEGTLTGGSSKAQVTSTSSTATHARCCADVVGAGSTITITGVAPVSPSGAWTNALPAIQPSAPFTLPTRTYSSGTVGSARTYSTSGSVAAAARPYTSATTLPARTYSTSSVGGIAAAARPYQG